MKEPISKKAPLKYNYCHQRQFSLNLYTPILSYKSSRFFMLSIAYDTLIVKSKCIKYTKKDEKLSKK